MNRLKRGLCALAGAGLAAAMTAGAGAAGAAAAATVSAIGTASAAGTPSQGAQVSPMALGVNTAPWDDALAGKEAGAFVPQLKSAGIRMLRYGGGSYADAYDATTNTSVSACPQGGPDAVTPALPPVGCATSNALDFRAFSAQAAAIGASTFVTLNYGTGTPAAAAAWVREARTVPGPGVGLWEVGNETYGCWEANDWLAQPPTSFTGYVPASGPGAVNPACPQQVLGSFSGTQTLADSYATDVRPFISAIKAAAPDAQVGVPWAFGSDVQGSAVPDSQEWNETVLGTDSSGIGFVDAHYYPFTFSGAAGGSNPSGQELLRSLFYIPGLYEQIQSTLDQYDPSAKVVVGETNVSNSATTVGCTPAGALFAAGDALSWLAAGAQTVDWWDLDNEDNSDGRCGTADFGMFTGSAQPESPYYGYELAAALAQPYAKLVALPTSDAADVLSFKSYLPGGKAALAFINTNTGSPEHVTFAAPSTMTSGTLHTLTYSSAEPQVTRGSTQGSSLAGGLTLPAESITVLEQS
jgi:hypothetical protein